MGTLSSTGGALNILELDDSLGIPALLVQPAEWYLVGWGSESANSSPIQFPWTIIVYHIIAVPKTYTTDFVDRRLALVIEIVQMDMPRLSRTSVRLIFCYNDQFITLPDSSTLISDKTSMAMSDCV